jgi:RND family efflux transporter MFP subunit
MSLGLQLPVRTKIRAVILGCAIVSGLAGCGREQATPAATGASAPPYPTLTLEPQRVTSERRVDGRVEAIDQGTISAQTSGEVIEVMRDASDSVPANGVVLRLRAVQQRAGLQQAEAALRAAGARAIEAEARYQRIADMFARKVVAKATFDQVTADRDGAIAARDAARAARDSAREGLSYTEVRMPFAGVVTDRFVRVGELVAPGTPLFAAAATGELRVITDVSQDLALLVQQRPNAAVYANDRVFEAAKVTVYPRAANDSAAFRVRIDLPKDAAGLLPGMFVKVGFDMGEDERLLVPVTAFVERGEVTGVYVYESTGAGRTVFRQVRLGHVRGDSVEVLAGVSAGERIATDPQLAMRALMAAQSE